MTQLNKYSEKQLKQTLKQVFGYPDFRLTQLDVIKRSLSRESSLVIIPTGGGKSICYQLPAVLMDGLTLVISPLIALMQDQVSALKGNGIAAGSLNSSASIEDELATREAVEAGTLKLLYVSPERAVSENFIRWIQNQSICQIAIDEAHCVSIWGNDFRPEYTMLTRLTKLFKNIPIIALTATADKATQDDIRQQLQLENCASFISSFERKNLFLSVLPANNRFELIKKFLTSQKNKAGIIYCLSRRSTEELSMRLNKEGFNSRFYHAAIKPEERNRIQDAFQQDKVQIICATIAFGMGIDKANIDWIIHYNLPKNIESYYQEIGRAGRAGQSASTLLFAGYRDIKTLKDFIDNSIAPQQFKDVQHAKLDRMWAFAQSHSCRTNFILNYFGEFKEEPCGHCDLCKTPPQRFDGTIIAQIALSACLRLNQSVTAATLIDVIRGSTKREILDQGYHQIKTYGVGKDIDIKSWSSYISQLIDQGFLSIDFTQGNILQLTELAKPVLQSNRNVLLVEPVLVEFKAKEDSQNAELKTEEQHIYDALSQLRRTIAEESQVQASRIFSNSTLMEIASRKPGNLAAFSSISGVGQYKLKLYGERFISTLNELLGAEKLLFLDDLEATVKSKKSKTKKTNKTHSPVRKLSQTHEITLEALKAGMNPDEIAKERELKVETIYSHMFRLNLQGHPIDISKLINANDISIIKEAWINTDKTGSSKQLYHALKERYRYDQIEYVMQLG